MLPQQQQTAQQTAGSPAAQPLDQAGLKARAIAQVQMATKILEASLPLIGSDTPEGEAIIQTLSKLSKHFGKQSNITETQMANMLMQQQAINALRQKIALQRAAQQQQQQQMPQGA